MPEKTTPFAIELDTVKKLKLEQVKLKLGLPHDVPNLVLFEWMMNYILWGDKAGSLCPHKTLVDDKMSEFISKYLKGYLIVDSDFCER